MSIKHENHLRHIHPVRHAKHPKPILQTKVNTFTTKIRGRPFHSAGEGGGPCSLCRVRIFISNLLRATIFIFIQLHNKPFILRYNQFQSDGCRIIIYFPRDPGQLIYFKGFDGQDVYFLKNCQPPPPPFRINCSSPNKKKGTSFNHSPIVPTAILNT